MKASLIVMGRRSSLGLARVRLGNTTAKVIGHAHCSVLVVPRETETGGRHLVLATDGSRHAQAATAMAATFAKILQAPTTAISAILPSHSIERQQEAASAARQAADFVAEQGIAADAEVLHGRPDEVIVQAAASKHADLIVVGSHGRTGLARAMLGSVSERVLDTAAVPVLVVKITARD